MKLAFGLLLLSLAIPSPAGAASPDPADWAAPALIQGDIDYLASDECAGRGVGTAGIERAQQYIAGEFGRLGLSPLGDGGTWFQKFDVITGVEMVTATFLEAPGKGKCDLGKEWSPLALSGSGSVPDGQLVFAGYGITAPSLHYDDYAGIDVRGKIVLALAHDPRELDQKSPFRAPEAFRYTEARYKAIAAREHGAAGLILVNDAWRHPSDADTPLPFDGGHAVSPAGLPVASVTAQLADRMLARLKKTSRSLGETIDSTLKPSSAAVPGGTVSLAIGLHETHGSAANVAGLLQGSDPVLAGEAIVVGAHHDHLGLGGVYSLSPSASAIHHGADDNASGVAGVLALARRFSKLPKRPARSLIFVTFSAEELGLLGSARYVKEPPFPLTHTAAMVNMDMIGRLRDGKLTVQGVETAAQFKPILDRAGAGSGLTIAYSGDGYGPSDQTSFYAKDRPVLFFFTGPHVDYHRPTDTADKVNTAGENQVLGVIAKTVEELASAAPITFVKSKSSASAHGSGSTTSTGRGYGPYFGSIPDFSEYKGGVLLSGTRPGSPADKAGVKGGDAIVKFGGVTIRNLEDLTYALQTHRPGDEIEVEVNRSGKVLRMKAVLEKRK